MDNSQWFDDVPVLGRMAPEKAAEKLREVGEARAVEAIESAAEDDDRGGRTRSFGSRAASWWPFGDRAWQHTAHAFGYLAPAGPGSELLPIRHAGNFEPDASLKNSRVRVTLDRLRVADYPGGGTHRVLFDFYAQNQLPGDVEHLHFNATYRAREGEQAALLGFPLFVGLNVGTAGVAFKCFTVNVENEEDEAFLGFLESDAFKTGLKLATTVQPAIAPLSSMAFALTKSIASRNRNVPVQEFYLGLDFTRVATGARLAEGSYLAVQIPETLQSVWDWNEWVYNPASGQVVSRADAKQLIPYNYIVFGVSRYEEPG
jgi:hypothetical protein